MADDASENMLPISLVPRRVQAYTGQPGPTLRVVYNRAVEGAFPAEFIRGRWMVPESAIPEVAKACGFRVVAAA